MKERTSLIRGILLEVRSRLGAAEACYRRKLLERLEKVDITANPERLEQELVLLAQRLDVTEELDRLEAMWRRPKMFLTAVSPWDGVWIFSFKS